MVRVALVQLEVDGIEAVDARVARALAIVDDVMAGGSGGLDVDAADEVDLDRVPDLVLLPELWAVGAFDTPTMLAHPVELDGPLIESLRSLVSKHAVGLHAGSFAEVDGEGRRFNTSVFIQPDGSVAMYRKIHLFGFDQGEAEVLEHGTELTSVPTSLGPMGLSTCYDLRFPELYRALAAGGAEVLAIPAGWPLRRIEHWRVLARARAIENQAWVLACNAVGENGGVMLGGRSAVIDPWGTVVVEALPDREGVLLADLDEGAVAAARTAFPVLRDRRM